MNRIRFEKFFFLWINVHLWFTWDLLDRINMNKLTIFFQYHFFPRWSILYTWYMHKKQCEPLMWMKINVFDNNVRLAPMSSWEHINAFIKVNYHFIRLFYGHREAIEPDLSYFAVDFISMCTLSHMSFQYRPARSLLLLSFHIRVPSCVYVHGLNCFPFFFFIRKLPWLY